MSIFGLKFYLAQLSMHLSKKDKKAVTHEKGENYKYILFQNYYLILKKT